LSDARYFSKRWIAKRDRTGFARTCNVGIENANPSNNIILLNNDIVAENDFISIMNNFAGSNEKIGIVGPKLIYPEGLGIQSAGSYLPLNSYWFDHVGRFQPIEKFNEPKEINVITGACIFIKHEVINKIGYLDDRYSMCFEDVDYCLRAMENGWQVWYCPDALLTHFENSTKGLSKEMMSKSLSIFWNQWEVIKNDGKPNGRLLIKRKNENSTGKSASS
jgi:GT2 family glycosyltransferase